MSDLQIAPPSIVGTSGNDVLIGTGSAELLFGLEGNDLLKGNGGSDRLDGGDGFDTASYTNLKQAIVAELQIGKTTYGPRSDILISIEGVVGTSYADILRGNSEANVLVGGFGDDILEGRGGNDRIMGGEGADAMSGGAGIDTISYINLPSRDHISRPGVTIDLTTQTVSGPDQWVTGDTISGFENAVGTILSDTLTGDSGANRLNAGPSGYDALYGLGGNDFLSLRGDGDSDILDGGAGFDTASYAQSQSGISVAINLRSGQMLGGARGDTLVSIEALIGTDGNDSLIMGDADNRVMGGAGNDFIDSGDGDDILIGGLGGDFLHGGEGIDTASYIGSNAGVQISLEDQTSTGGHAEGDTHSWIHNINGSQHDDVITGNLLNNRLRGMDGDDILTGRAGRDTLFGGEGDDVFVFTDLADHVSATQSDTSTLTVYANNTRDRIRDFTNGEDLLQFDAGDFSGAVVNTDQIADLGLLTATDTAFAYTGSELYFVTYASVADFNADQVTVYHLAHLTGGVSLTDSDFSFL